MRYGGIIMTSGDKDQKSNVSWCWKQKHGIALEEPNDNLCKAYMGKAKSALNILNSAIEKEEVDWIATTAYYARYFALYGLLRKCGIKSEIHDCSISLMHFLLVEETIVEEKFYAELLSAKELRVDMQYYVTEQIDMERLRKGGSTAGNFVLRMEEATENLTEDRIQKIRQKLTDARF